MVNITSLQHETLCHHNRGSLQALALGHDIVKGGSSPYRYLDTKYGKSLEKIKCVGQHTATDASTCKKLKLSWNSGESIHVCKTADFCSLISTGKLKVLKVFLTTDSANH